MNTLKGKNDIYDPLGIELFAIDETFESVFNGLRGVYFRIYYKETIREGKTIDAMAENKYYKRFRELGRLKRSYRFNDWKLKEEAVQIYSKELKEMIRTELESYPPFINQLDS